MTVTFERNYLNMTVVMVRGDGSTVTFTDEEWKLLMRAADDNLFQRYQSLLDHYQISKRGETK